MNSNVDCGSHRPTRRAGIPERVAGRAISVDTPPSRRLGFRPTRPGTLRAPWPAPSHTTTQPRMRTRPSHPHEIHCRTLPRASAPARLPHDGRRAYRLRGPAERPTASQRARAHDHRNGFRHVVRPLRAMDPDGRRARPLAVHGQAPRRRLQKGRRTMTHADEYGEGLQALKELALAIRRVAETITDAGTRDDLQLLAGIARGLSVRFERYQPEGRLR